MHQDYLGDGVYAKDDGEMLELYTERQTGRHWLALGSYEISALLRFLQRSRGLVIQIQKLPSAEEPEAVS